MQVLRAFACSVVLVVLLVGCAKGPEPQHDLASDRAAIESALRQWPKDFNEENLPAVCGLFADDVILSALNSPDRDHHAFCNQMQTLFADPAKRYSYAEPKINEVLVDGDLATVRLIWTLTITDASGKVLEKSQEDGVDVFQRQPDGSWKIHVSHAFPK